MAELTIADVRERFPQYNDMSDGDLADAIHKKYYSDMDVGAFRARIGFDPTAQSVRPVARPSGPDALSGMVEALQFPDAPGIEAAPRQAPTAPPIPSPDMGLPSVDARGGSEATNQRQQAVDAFMESLELDRHKEAQIAAREAEAANARPPTRFITPQPTHQFAQGRGAIPPQPVLGSAEPDPFEGEGLGPLSARRGQQFMRGLTEVGASVPEALAIKSTRGQISRIEASEEGLGFWNDRIQDIETRLNDPEITEEERAFRQQELEDLRIGAQSIETMTQEDVIYPRDRPIYAQGQRLRDASLATFGEPDPRDASFWAKVAEGGGNMTGFVGVAGAGTMLGGPAGGFVAGGFAGSKLNESALYREAIETGAPEDVALRASQWGALIGASEVLPITRLFRGLPKPIKDKVSGAFFQRLGTIAMHSGEEGVQEYLATVANNMVAQNLYDPERGLTDGATEAGLVGAVLGGGMGAGRVAINDGVSALSGNNAAPVVPSDPDGRADLPAPVTETPAARPEPETLALTDEMRDAEAVAQPEPLPVDARTVEVEQPAPPSVLPEGEADQSATPDGGTPVSAPQVAEASEARVGLNPNEWSLVPGMANGQPTGRDFMENQETGEVIPKAEYDARLAESPKVEGEVDQVEGEGNDDTDTTIVPREPSSVPDPSSDVRDPSSDVRGSDPARSVDGTGGTPDADQAPVVAEAAADAGTPSDTPAAVDAGAARTPDVADLSEETAAPEQSAAADIPAQWDQMDQSQRESVLRDIGAPSNRDGVLNAGAQKIAGQSWADLSENNKTNITSRLITDGPDVRSDPNPDLETMRSEIERTSEKTTPTETTERDLDVAGRHWGNLTNPERNRLMIGVEPSSRPETRAKYYKQPWDALGKNLQNRLSKVMPDKLFRAKTSEAAPTGAAADPAFKAAKDSGKLEVVSVTGETEASKKPVPPGQRSLADGGARWDNMTVDQRKQLLRDFNPTGDAAVRDRFAAKAWSDMSESLRAKVTEKMPESVFNPVPTAEAIDQEAAEADTNPTDAQKEAGNYKAGHIRWNGLEITIENAKGSERSGVDSDGEAWSVEMPAHYGYIRKTEGADGDHVDVYIGETPESEKVYVIDQLNLDRTFDEHKVMIGFHNVAEARNVHRKAFSDGRGAQRLGSITPMTVDEFKAWLADGDTSMPLSERLAKKVQTSDKTPAQVNEVSGTVKPDATDTAPEPDTDQPVVALARRLAATIDTLEIANGRQPDGLPSTNTALMKMAAEAFGGTIAEGKFSPKDAYDALELAVNMHLAGSRTGKESDYDPKTNVSRAKSLTSDLQKLVEALPTQTRRDTETDTFQQFSTPPAYAFAANWIANIQRGERVLEPSAGNGGIAVFAKNAGATVDVNELADRRLPSLKALGFDRVTNENAEQIANIWAKDSTRSYDAVVMNPPFSASAGRTNTNTSATGAKHIEQALDMLKPGGRLVAIMGNTFQPGNARLKPFFDRIASDHVVRANVVVKGDQVYKKYGTTYDNRILVIDKRPAKDGETTLTGEAGSIPDLIEMMEGIRNEADGRSTKTEAASTDGKGPSGDGGAKPSEDGGGSARGQGKLQRDVVADDLGGATDQSGRNSGTDNLDGSASRPDGDSKGADGKRKANGTDGRSGTSGSGRKSADGRRRPSVRVTEAEQSSVEETSGGFAKYNPGRIKIEGATAHPMALVESAAMASVRPPMPNYDIQLPRKMVSDGLLSEAQLEQVVYAGAAHAETLPPIGDAAPRRKGYYIGDGTGVGKTREIAGIIADNWAQGRKKSILISKDKKLLKGARRDFDNIGMNRVPIADLGKVKPDGSIDKKSNGVLFSTYSTLGRSPKAGQQSRIDQIVEALGTDFDGAIIFDEAHLAGNAIERKGKRGTSKPSATALAVIELQNRLPDARVVYASATAATEVSNLAYADRLGLWGPGTPFENVHEFVNQIEKGGIAAMEVVARDMKQMGVYNARTLSFDGVEYEKVEHALTESQRQMYDAAATAWQNVLANVEEAINVHTEGGGRQRGAAMAQFWSAHQRFFQQVLTSMQMPTVISDMEADLKAGRSPVVQIVNTNEAATKRAMSKMEQGDTLDDIDITPREDLMQYLATSFPVTQYESYVDDSGNTRQRPVTDADGNFIQNKKAVEMRDNLMDHLGAMTLPGNPIDMIVEKFGSDNVAEVTGRSSRIVMKDGKKVEERRSQPKTLAEASEFQGAKRDILIFSEAGGTGMDFHADKDAKNTKRRAHYVLQAGWRADRAIQGFGRTHRTNQVQPPIYKLAGTNLSGHKRFTSSIARRLDQLGALTKGQKDAGGSTMFNATDNLENQFAEEAVTALFFEIYRGEVDGFTTADATKELGLRLEGESGFSVTKIPPVTQFLNRLLNTTIDRQNMLFDRFVGHMENAVQLAIDEGRYTSGVEQINHEGADLVDTKEAFRDKRTGATSQYQMIKLTQPVKVTPLADLQKQFKNLKFKKDRNTGTVYAFRPASSRTAENGEVIPTYHRYTATDRVTVDSSNYQFRYDKVSDEDAAANWAEQIEDAPATREETVHLVTGTLLPIWDRLPVSSPKIVRVELDNGQQLLGRQIPDQELTRTLERLGVTADEIDMSPAEVQQAVLQGKNVVFSSGHKLVRRRVGGEQRIEIVSPNDRRYQDMMPGGVMQRLGFQIEKIQYQPRAFAATGEMGLKPIEDFMLGKDIVNITMTRDKKARSAPISFSDRLENIKLFKDLRARLDKFGLQGVELQYDPTVDFEGHAEADFFGNMVLTIGNTLNPKWTLGHEAIHFYKHMGVFTKSEWSVLEAEAKAKWMDQYDIPARYAELNEADQIEEAVAEAFGEAYQKGSGFRTKSGVRAALGRINNFLKAIRSWAKGNGFQTADDVIHALARGDFAKRTNKTPKDWDTQMTRLRRPRPRRSEPGQMHIPDRKIWDSLWNTNGNIFAKLREARGAAGDRFDNARFKFQDRFLPMLRAQQIIEREMDGALPEELDAYLAEEMYSGRAGFKLDSINRDFTSKIIKIIGDNKNVTLETAGQFLYARHAAERNARIAEINPDMPDGGSGMSSAEAQMILDAINDSAEVSAYNEIAELIDKLRENTINERVEMGLMTDTEAKSWRNAYKSYVPLKGWAETDYSDAELDVTGVGRGYSVRGDETRRAMGRRTEAFNPLIAALTMAQEVAIRGEKNRVGQTLYRLVSDVPAKSLWEIKKVETTRVFNESTGLVEERSLAPISMLQASNEVAVKVDGVEHRIVINDPKLAQSVNSVGTDNLGAGLVWLSKFSRYFSAINTMLNPVFVVKNFVRDTVTANINIQSKEMANKIQKGMMKDLPKALKGAYRGMGGKSDTEWSKYYQEYSETGGKVSFWVMEQPEANKNKIQKRLNREANGVKGMALGMITPNIEMNPILSAIERINLAVDNAIRLSAFVHARKNGYSAEKAASLSKNLTVNFNRRGQFGSLINAAYTFSNAGFQGTHIMFKALKTKRVQMIVAGLVGIGFLLDQANTYLSDEDEDGQLYYDKMRGYLHENHMLMMLGTQPDSAQSALSLWLPYGYNVFPLLGNLVSRATRGQVGTEEAVKSFARSVFSSFSPISERTLMGTMSPTIVDPVLQVSTNQNFLGWDIHPGWDDNAPNSLRAKTQTSELSQVIAARLNAWTGGNYVESGYIDVFPDDIDYIAGFLTGGVGRTFGQSVDVFAKMFNPDAEVSASDVPLVRDLYRQIGESETRSLYFDRVEMVREAHQDAKDLHEMGQPIPDHIAWKARLYETVLEAERFRRGTARVSQDVQRAYMMLNSRYVAAWKENTAYSSESIFD